MYILNYLCTRYTYTQCRASRSELVRSKVLSAVHMSAVTEVCMVLFGET